MRIWTIATAQAEMLKRLEQKRVEGGSYIHENGNRCAIGWLLTEEHAERAEGQELYPYPRKLMELKFLAFKEENKDQIGEWLRQIQRLVDQHQWVPARKVIQDGPL